MPQDEVEKKKKENHFCVCNMASSIVSHCVYQAQMLGFKNLSENQYTPPSVKANQQEHCVCSLNEKIKKKSERLGKLNKWS